MLKAIIFDMDGVLVQSSEAIRRSFEKVFEKDGLKIDESNKSKYSGVPLADVLKLRKVDFGITTDRILEDIAKESLKYQLEHMENTLEPNPDIHKIIQEAKAKGIKIAVATSSTKKRAILFLEKTEIAPLLDARVTYEDLEKGKPNPDIFLKAASLVNIDPENCLVIEDAVNGVQAAKAAGMKCLGKIGEHTAEELGKADTVFSDFKDITLSDLEQLRKN